MDGPDPACQAEVNTSVKAAALAQTDGWTSW
jgi:hypothetical protein